jgi:hypothetical protein
VNRLLLEDAYPAELAKAPLNFDPQKTVLVASSIPAPANPGPGAAANPGSVQITSYQPKHVILHSDAPAATVMLLNDKYDAGWKAEIDGKPAEMIKCNFFMQGLQLPPGAHNIVLTFKPPQKGLYISLVALLIGFGLSGILVAVRRSNSRPETTQPQPKPVLQKK